MEAVGVFPDHLEVTVTGAPPLNVLYGEVGLKESVFGLCRRGDLNPHALAGTSPSIRDEHSPDLRRFAYPLLTPCMG